MKHILTIMAFTLLAVGAYAQENNNEDKAREYNNGRHKGLDFSIKSGVLVGVGDAKGINTIPVDISLGKQCSSNLYFGLSTGANIGMGSHASTSIPIAADFKLMAPLESTNLKPILGARIGYSINTKKPDAGAILMEVMPGVQVPISKTKDFLLQLGYAHEFATKGSGGSGAFAVKLGFNFHKNPYRIKKGPRREKSPIRKHGVQFTLEGGGGFSTNLGYNYGGNFILGYKINPHLFVGAGFGYNILSGMFGGYDYGIQVISTYRDDNYHRYDCYLAGDITAIDGFARLTYRISKRRWSPLLNLDLGVSHLSYSEWLYDGNASWGGSTYNLETNKKIFGEPKSLNLYATPSFGLSVRAGRNTYFDLKAGYQFRQNFGGKKVIYTEGDRYPTTYYGAMREIPLSSFVFTLGITHTFGERGKRLR